MTKRMFLFMLLTIMLGLFSTGWANTLYVPADYSTIQAAVSSAAAGDVVQVAAGTYNENIVVPVQLTLQGAGSTTIINGAGGVVLALPAGTDAFNRTVAADLKLTGGTTGLTVGSYTTLSNIVADGNISHGINLNPLTDLTIDGCSFINSVAGLGLKLASTASASYVTITNSHFDNNYQGWYSDASSSVEPDLDYLTISYTTFNNNSIKGFYTERLSNALFDDVTVNGSGNLASYTWGAGFDINLKWKSYSNIVIQNSDFINCGLGSKNGVGLTVKGRDDGGTYGANPAYVSGVSIIGCTVTGNERGIRIGEPGANNATPVSVVVTGCTVNSNAKTYAGTDGSPYGDVINATVSDGVTLEGEVLVAGKAVFNIVPGQSLQSAINAAATGSIINVAAGTYNEQITINKPLTLSGAQAGIPARILDGNGWPTGAVRTGSESIFTSTYAVVVTSSGVIIDGFKFINFRYGINIQDYAGDANAISNVQIINNILDSQYAWVGILLGESCGGSGDGLFSNILIENNIVKGDNTLGGDPYMLDAIGFTSGFANLTLNEVHILRNEISNNDPDQDYLIFGGANPLTSLFTNSEIAYNWLHEGAGSNCGYMGNTIIHDNLFENLSVYGFVVSLNGGAIYNNTARECGVYAFGLWGGEWDTQVSQNVNIYGNDITYNDLTPNANPYTAGIRIRPGVDATLIHFDNNSIINGGGACATNWAINNSGTGTADATPNWWGSADYATIAAMFNGPVSFDPWWANAGMSVQGSNMPIENVTQNTFFSDIQAAIDAADNGDVIEIAEGNYEVTSTIIVNKEITLSGPEPSRVGPAIIEGTNPTVVCVLEITASNVTVENFEFTHSALPAYTQTPPWIELPNSLVRIPANQMPVLSNIVFTNNKIYVPTQSGAMSTWNGVALCVGSVSVNTATISGNTLYNTRNGIVIQYNNYVSLSNNVIYNTKGGIMNYTNTLADADSRIMTNNSWGTVHNEWDIVWNTAYVVPNYELSVMGISTANNGAYVLDRRAADAIACAALTGNRSHIFVDDNGTATAPHPANGNMNNKFTTLALALDAVVPGGTVYVAAGTYTEQVRIAKNNLKIYGESKDTVIIKSPATLPLSYTTGEVNKPVVFIDGVANVTLTDITIDGDYKGNANYRFQGVGFWNAGGLLEDVDVINVMDNPFSGAQHGVGIYHYNNTPDLSYSIALNRVNVTNFQKNALALNGNSSTRNLTVNLDYVTATGQGPTDVTAQNGIQVTYATGTIDNCSVSGIYWTGPTWTAAGILLQATNGLVAANNTVTGCQAAIYAYGNVGLGLQSNIINAGSDYGILEYSGINSTINLNVITGAVYGLYCYQTDGADVTGNTLNGNEYALILLGTNHTVSGNNFGVNEIQVYNGGAAIDMNALAAANNWPGGYFIMGQIIYSTSTEMLYVDAPKELIKDVETQTYSVKALYLENLRGFTVQIAVPRADFAAPNINTAFALGSAYASYTGMLMPVVYDNTDPLLYKYTVSGTFIGGFTGITGSNQELFTVQLTSLLDRDNVSVPGCWVNLPLSAVELRDAQNPYSVIPCISTEGKLIIIDASEPTMVHNNALAYPSGMTLNVLPDGTSNLDRPIFNLTYSDNYNLDDVKYLIQPEGDAAPALISQFPAQFIVENFNGLTTTLDWQLPLAVDALADGTYTLYYLVTDDAVNFTIYDWDFTIDTTAPAPIVWTLCRVTPNANNSIDMQWNLPVDAAKVSVWYLNYDNLAGAGSYPEYNPAGFAVPPVPGAPNPYNPAAQNGWTRFYYGSAISSYTWAGMARGYYHITVFTQDSSGNYSTAPTSPFYRESLSYWPGDVTTTPDVSVVTGADIAMLSAVWGLNSTSPYWVPIIDVGPSTDYGRLSRPTPDNVINIEDLMMFAMNWNNTNYDYYPRFEGTTAKPVPIRIELQTSSEADLVRVDLVLQDNNGLIKGLNIPVRYGTGLSLQSVLTGSIWSENCLLLYTNTDNVAEVSVTELGGNSIVSGNGIIATLYFDVTGSDTGMVLQRMIARDAYNREIGIVNNPGSSTGSEEETIIPQVTLLESNYPNPFNPETTIRFGLKQSGKVSICIYNSRGQVVRTLVDETKSAGYHRIVWNGKDDNNRTLASGMYFYRMEAGSYTETRKAILMK
jgi:hypothetical protein